MSALGLIRIRDLRGLWRLGALQVSDPEVRAKERHRRATLSGLAAASARLVGIGTSLVTVPLTLSYLGSERFGVWMAISSVLAIMNFADFGIGNGVMNAVADAFGKNDMVAVRRAISSGFAVLMAIAVVLISGFACLYPYVDWARVFNAHSPLAQVEAGPGLFVFALFFSLNIPIGLVQRVQMGLQEGFRAYVWQLVGSIAGLCGVLIVVHCRGGLPWLLVALSGSPVAVAALNGILYFGSHREVMPALQFVAADNTRKIGNLGFLFFVLQLVCALAFSSDNFILARVLGPESATEYAVPQRMFLLISSLMAMLLAPLWPAYAEAIARGDSAWVRTTLLRSLKLALSAAAVGVTVLVCCGQQIVHLWVGPKVQPTLTILLGFALWTLFDVTGNVVAMFLNGASIIKFQVIIAAVFGTVCVSTKIFAARHFGGAALPWTTALTYCLCVTVPTLVVLPRLLERTCGQQYSAVAADK